MEKRHAIQRKEDDGQGLDVLTDECVKEAVEMQTEAGFRGISDGEYRRHMYCKPVDVLLFLCADENVGFGATSGPP